MATYFVPPGYRIVVLIATCGTRLKTTVMWFFPTPLPPYLFPLHPSTLMAQRVDERRATYQRSSTGGNLSRSWMRVGVADSKMSWMARQRKLLHIHNGSANGMYCKATGTTFEYLEHSP